MSGSKKITPTELRADVYRYLDEVIDTGVPLEVVRKGHVLRIVPERRERRLTDLEPHDDFIRGDPEDLVHMDWSGEWKP